MTVTQWAAVEAVIVGRHRLPARLPGGRHRRPGARPAGRGPMPGRARVQAGRAGPAGGRRARPAHALRGADALAAVQTRCLTRSDGAGRRGRPRLRGRGARPWPRRRAAAAAPRSARGEATCAAGRDAAGVTVHFIGAGPGAADLITLRGARPARRCPVCLYAGSIVPPRAARPLPARRPPGRHRPARPRRDRGGVRRRPRRRAGRGPAAFRRPVALQRGGRAAAAPARARHPASRSPPACPPSPPPPPCWARSSPCPASRRPSC